MGAEWLKGFRRNVFNAFRAEGKLEGEQLKYLCRNPFTLTGSEDTLLGRYKTKNDKGELEWKFREKYIVA